MAIFDLVKNVRIVTDGLNYVPELYLERKNEKEETIGYWKRFGYYINFESAINRALEVYPVYFQEDKNIKTMKDIIQDFKKVKKEICVKITKQIKEEK